MNFFAKLIFEPANCLVATQLESGEIQEDNFPTTNELHC